MAKRIYLVTGDRFWDDERRMRQVFGHMTPSSLLLQGGARGADRMARDLAPEYHLFGVEMPYAGWLGKGGGAARNRKMLALIVGLRTAAWSVRVIGFHDDLAASRGTKGMVRSALDERFPVMIVSRVSAKTLRTSDDLRKHLRGA